MTNNWLHIQVIACIIIRSTPCRCTILYHAIKVIHWLDSNPSISRQLIRSPHRDERPASDIKGYCADDRAQSSSRTKHACISQRLQPVLGICHRKRIRSQKFTSAAAWKHIDQVRFFPNFCEGRCCWHSTGCRFRLVHSPSNRRWVFGKRKYRALILLRGATYIRTDILRGACMHVHSR
jgi:hypothetical protein